MDKGSRILVLGGSGLVGSAIVRALVDRGYTHVDFPTHKDVSLIDHYRVRAYFGEFRPEYVFMAAGMVGGIKANDSLPVHFLMNNLRMATNVIDVAHETHVTKLLYLGSSCVYPRDCPQPIKEEYLLTGPLEPTNEWYSLAKIAGIKLCQAYRKQYGCNFISAMPCNLYGPNDNFDLETSHVIPALINEAVTAEAKMMPWIHCWGTGTPLREFLYVDDLADACLFLMEHYEDGMHINVGSGEEISIRDLAYKIARLSNRDQVRLDPSKPDGTPRKILDSSRIRALGWKPKVGLDDGLKRTYDLYREHHG